MKRQIPRGVAGAVLVIATLSVLWLVGRLTPTTPLTQSPLIGKEAPVIVAPMEGNKKLTLADFKGKVVLVNFWATWCGPCKMEIPDLVALQKQYEAKGFTVVGLSRDAELETALGFAKEQQLNYPIALGTDEALIAFGKPEGIPTSYLIDREGKIAEVFQGLTNKELLETAIQRAL